MIKIDWSLKDFTNVQETEGTIKVILTVLECIIWKVSDRF